MFGLSFQIPDLSPNNVLGNVANARLIVFDQLEVFFTNGGLVDIREKDLLLQGKGRRHVLVSWWTQYDGQALHP